VNKAIGIFGTIEGANFNPVPVLVECVKTEDGGVEIHLPGRLKPLQLGKEATDALKSLLNHCDHVTTDIIEEERRFVSSCELCGKKLMMPKSQWSELEEVSE
jgi:hypothetical protein